MLTKNVLPNSIQSVDHYLCSQFGYQVVAELFQA